MGEQDLTTLVRLKMDQATYQALQKQLTEFRALWKTTGQELGVVSVEQEKLNAAFKRGEVSEKLYQRSLAGLEGETAAYNQQLRQTEQAMVKVNSALTYYEKSQQSSKVVGREAFQVEQQKLAVLNEETAVLQSSVTALQARATAQEQAIAVTQELRRQETGWIDALSKEAAVTDQVATKQLSLYKMGRATGGLARGIGMVAPAVLPAGQVGATSFRAIYGAQVYQQAAPDIAAKLGVSTLAVGAAAVGLVGGMLLINKALDTSKKKHEEAAASAERYAASISKVNEIVVTGTREELRAAIDNAQKQLAIAEANREDVAARVEAARAGGKSLEEFKQDAKEMPGLIQDVRKGFGQIGEGLGLVDFNADLDAMQGELDKADQAVSQAQQNLDGLTDAYEDNATAANDAAEAVKKFSAETVEGILSDMSNRMDAAKQALSADDPEQVKQEIAGLNLEYEASVDRVNALIDAHQRGLITEDDYVKALSAEATAQSDLKEKIDLLNTVVMDAANARAYEINLLKQEKEALEAASERREKYMANLQNLTGAQEAGREFVEESAQLFTERQWELNTQMADQERQRAKDIAQHYADLAELDAKYADKVADQLEKQAEVATESDKAQLKVQAAFYRDNARLAEDHADKMLDLQRQLDSDVEGAIEERNIAAAIKAARSAKEKAEDANKEYEKEKERRAEDYADRLDELKDQRNEKLAAGRKALDDLKRQHDKERQANIAAFNQKIHEEDEQRRIAIQRQQLAWANEDASRMRHFQNTLVDYGLYWGQVKTITDQGMSNVTQAIANAWASLQPKLGIPGVATVPGGNPPSGQYWPTAYQFGGRHYGGGLLKLGETGTELGRLLPSGAWEIYSHAQSRQMAGGLQVNLNMPIQTTGDPDEIVRVVTAQFGELRRAIQQLQPGRAS